MPSPPPSGRSASRPCGSSSAPARIRPDDVYRSYLEQSDVFVGIYWESYGWVGPGATISGIEDELERSRGRPQLIYVKEPAPERDAGLDRLLDAA